MSMSSGMNSGEAPAGLSTPVADDRTPAASSVVYRVVRVMSSVAIGNTPLEVRLVDPLHHRKYVDTCHNRREVACQATTREEKAAGDGFYIRIAGRKTKICVNRVTIISGVVTVPNSRWKTRHRSCPK